MPIKIGLIGKTNTGKTTFFNSSTLSSDEISTYPFTTKKSSTSVGYAITLCVHPEFKISLELRILNLHQLYFLLEKISIFNLIAKI